MGTAPDRTLDDELATLAGGKGNELDEALRRALALVAYPEDVPLPEDLTPDQRRLAEVLATRSGLAMMTPVAMPYHVQFRRRWLGLVEGGALEQRFPFEFEGQTVSWPLWRIWQVVGDEPDEGTGLSALFHDRVLLLDAYLDTIFWNPYGGVRSSRIWGHTKRLGPEAGEWAKRRLDDIASWPVGKTTSNGSVRWTIAPGETYGHETFEPALNAEDSDAQSALFIAIVRSGRTIEPAWERFFPMSAHVTLPEMAAAFPDERREIALRARLDHVVAKDGLFAVFRLWPTCPYPALASWVDDLLSRPAREHGFDPGSVRQWKAVWKELTEATPVLGAKPAEVAMENEPPPAAPKASVAAAKKSKTATAALGATKGAPKPRATSKKRPD